MLIGMASSPITSEVGGALGAFFHGGGGPSHSELSAVFTAAGYAGADPYDQAAGVPNKEQRVMTVVRVALRRPDGARALVDGLTERLRLWGTFGAEGARCDPTNVKHLSRALGKAGWLLTDDGYIQPLGAIDLTTGGRTSLDEQMERIRRSPDDPGILLGSAKDLLEAAAKFVLNEVGVDIGSSPSFGHLQYMARDRLKLNPKDVDGSLPGAEHIRAVLQSSVKIAEEINGLRALQGVGHGRTLPTGVTPELAWLVIREACSLAELMLTTLDRMYGTR